MPNVKANGITIEYDTFGDSSAAPLLLIMGLGAQMVLWEEAFCGELADRGHWVIRLDNRDIGLSSKLDDLGIPDVMAAMGNGALGRPIDAPYTLHDMAADVAGFLDALNISAAHVVGASMGGMIAQTLAIDHPRRVRTLTSIMSTTGNRSLPPPKPEAIGTLLTPPPGGREESIERAVSVFRTIGSPGFPFDEANVRARAARSYDRCFHPAGVVRQLVAILAQDDRTAPLHSLTIPALVIHGSADPLVPVEAGKATAGAMPGARLLIIEGMGHDLPRPAWPQIIDAICALTQSSQASARRAHA